MSRYVCIQGFNLNLIPLRDRADSQDHILSLSPIIRRIIYICKYIKLIYVLRIICIMYIHLVKSNKFVFDNIFLTEISQFFCGSYNFW